MKKFMCVIVLSVFNIGFGQDGAGIFKKCVACHGAKADVVYLKKVPALKSLSLEERASALKEYQAGKRNKFNQGAIMKAQLKGLSATDLDAVNKYIETLKK